MKPEKCIKRKEGNSRTPKVQIAKTSAAAEEVTVVTPSSILKFILFFTGCLAFAVLVVGWYLGHFERILTR